MQHATQPHELTGPSQLMNRKYERVADRVHLIFFSAMLIFMGIGYLGLCGFLLLAFF
jgi:hypothetical protein